MTPQNELVPQEKTDGLPKQVIANVTHKMAKTVAEIDAELRERGLPVELLEHLRKMPDVLQDGEGAGRQDQGPDWLWSRITAVLADVRGHRRCALYPHCEAGHAAAWRSPSLTRSPQFRRTS
jgi:hypothetical protein